MSREFQKGLRYYEFQKPGATINGERHRRQLIKLKQAKKKIFLTMLGKNYLENRDCEVLPHLPYSPDLVPSNYFLFRPMSNALTGIQFTSEQFIKNWLDLLMAAKPTQFPFGWKPKITRMMEKCYSLRWALRMINTIVI